MSELAGVGWDAAYRWASHAVRGRDVLVVGPDSGGATLLAQGEPRSVTAVAAHELDGCTAGFGAAVCFGVLETASDPDPLVARLRDLLSPDGLLLLSLPLVRPEHAAAAPPGQDRMAATVRTAEQWRETLTADFSHVELARMWIGIAAVVMPASGAEAPLPIDEIAGSVEIEGSGRALAVAGEPELPRMPAVASLGEVGEATAMQQALEEWERRARRAEAEASAKHWEVVAAREAQRRLRRRLHQLEHRPLRVLSRVVRGRPARLGPGPPIRASERKREEWD